MARGSLLLVLLLGLLPFSLSLNADVWSPVDAVLSAAVTDGAFPGCVAIVGNQDGYLYAKAFGNYTYGVPPPNNKDNPPMELDTMFDMASCTKVVATTTAIAQFYQRGELALDDTIASIIGPQFAVNKKGGITVRNCLLHDAGFYPDPIPFYSTPQFGCPDTKDYHPPLDFSCQEKIYLSQMNESLQYPIGAVYQYSDLSFMTLMHVVGTLAMKYGYVSSSDLVPGCAQGGLQEDQCYYEAYVRKYVIKPLNVTNTQFLPPSSLWGNCAPTVNDTVYMHAVIQGVVQDPNTYADGGISGHAGLFSTAEDLFVFMKQIMYSNEDDSYMNSTTYELFIKEYNHSQSSRALGWNTNDPTVYDEGWNQSCGSLSPFTFMHTGYTGTMLCGDPDRQLIAILLTNRVYPTETNEKVLRVRQLFGNAVQQIYDANFANSAPKAKTVPVNILKE